MIELTSGLLTLLIAPEWWVVNDELVNQFLHYQDI